jgi:hypothetical protein
MSFPAADLPLQFAIYFEVVPYFEIVQATSGQARA